MKSSSKPEAFAADVYMDAAREHIDSARQLHERERFPLAMYVAGLAVESMLRAYKRRHTQELDERHDLRKLSKAAKIVDNLPPSRTLGYGLHLGVVATHWTNLHRFRSEAALRKWLWQQKLSIGIKGDVLKELSRKLLNASFTIVSIGEETWKMQK